MCGDDGALYAVEFVGAGQGKKALIAETNVDRMPRNVNLLVHEG